MAHGQSKIRPTCHGKIPLLTKNHNFALAQAKYLCMSSAHISQDEKRTFLTIQTAKFPLINQARNVAISAALFYPEK